MVIRSLCVPPTPNVIVMSQFLGSIFLRMVFVLRCMGHLFIYSKPIVCGSGWDGSPQKNTSGWCWCLLLLCPSSTVSRDREVDVSSHHFAIDMFCFILCCVLLMETSTVHFSVLKQLQNNDMFPVSVGVEASNSEFNLAPSGVIIYWLCYQQGTFRRPTFTFSVVVFHAFVVSRVYNAVDTYNLLGGVYLLDKINNRAFHADATAIFQMLAQWKSSTCCYTPNDLTTEPID
jgi:hypothetical protein